MRFCSRRDSSIRVDDSPTPNTMASLPPTSLDNMAGQRRWRRRGRAATVGVTGDAIDGRNPSDSRSTSSTSSPAPLDNEESDFFAAGNDSQSSLGVPNLQDMQVTDDECLPPINRLPNEILIAIFSKLSQSSDILHVMLTCKRWARNSVDVLWHRPACTNWNKHASICQTLGVERPYFMYRDFIRRLNLAALADKVNDGSVMPLAVCTRVERLTLTNCKGLTDSGLIALVENSHHLSALDISGDEQITEASIYAIADNCPRLQGLNISSCTKIAPESMVQLAKSCKYIKRLKLNDCQQMTDEAVLAFAEHCPNILEIDLHQCRLIQNEPVTALLTKGRALRELRLANCELVDDGAFMSLPRNRTFEHLRILDLTSCARLTDQAVDKIIDAAPRLRNLVLAKCRNITDAAVFAISRLGKNLHYVHLGHCIHITDEAVKRLVAQCNRIRYIDLGCCSHLTDDSVTKLATLPKLKRIGLVKCNAITDESVYALAKANLRLRARRDEQGNPIPGAEHYSSSHSSLERVHLSYCTSLTVKSIIRLLNSCPRLTHLSLTGVSAFLRDDLEQFSRDAPPEFTDHQRNMFCVFSGQGVMGLRKYLNNERDLADLHDTPGRRVYRQPHQGVHFPGLLPNGPPPPQGGPALVDANFDDGEPDVIDDDDGLEDGSEMAIDTQPLVAPGPPPAASGADLGAPPVPPPPPEMPIHPVAHHPLNDSYTASGDGHLPELPLDLPAQRSHTAAVREDEDTDSMDMSPAGPSATGASTAPLGPHGQVPHPGSSAGPGQASSVGSVTTEGGPSTAAFQGQQHATATSGQGHQNSGHNDER